MMAPIEALQSVMDIFIHLDRHLSGILSEYGTLTYGILFLIIFCETGLVVLPFLPGDSLLFAAGALSVSGGLNVVWLFVLLCVAAIIGDAVNYWVGYRIGPALFAYEWGPFLKKAHLARAERFYAKHGGKAIVLARFVPILRTFAPFVAGIGKMAYRRFVCYNVGGGMLWVALFVFGGYGFGNLPFVKNNFTRVILAIIVLSVLPIFIEWMRGRKETGHVA
jgi:membrane-associated protein